MGGRSGRWREKHAESDLVGDLRRLGVKPGGVLLVQSSLRSIGPVVGGDGTVVQALRRALGPRGTLVAYTATPENSRSSPLYRAATAGMSGVELEQFHRDMPAFDPAETPSSPTIGRLAEAIRTTPGALRSSHPQTSFAAVGPEASFIVGSHPLEGHLDDGSPLGRLYELKAKALLVGIGSARCTPFHLAEYRVPDPPRRAYHCVVRDAEGKPTWATFQGVDLDDRHFSHLGTAVRRKVVFGEGRLGHADCLLVPIVPAVDAATDWLVRHRSETTAIR